jgi:DNA-directed RNA polymerase specialized sigma24 family protein
VPEDEASKIAEQVIRNIAIDCLDGPESEADFTAKVLDEASSATRSIVAEQRRSISDPQVHHDPEDRRYEQNLDLDRLKKKDPERGFQDREWNRLPDILRPLAFATLSRKGIKGHDAEDVFNDTLVELVREREDGRGAPIMDPTVFEELIPLHARIVGFRAVDWYRRRGTLKNKPNAGASLEEMTDNPDGGYQFEDKSVDPEKPTFESIYEECRDALSASEWDLIFRLYVAQSHTIQDLIKDNDFCVRAGIKASASGSTRRRVLAAQVEAALEKIKEHLEN